MNAKWFTIAMIGAGLALAPTSRASEKGNAGEHKEAGEPGKMPDTLTGLWHEIGEKQEELAQVIKDKKLSEVHKLAFAIRDLAKLLPDKSKDLSADNQKKLKTWVDGVADSAKKLDEFGDAGDQANTEKEAKRLDTLLKSIEKLYPPDALKHGEKGESEHGPMYVCTMCPDVASDKPGKCPKCGMDLKPRAEAPHQDHDAEHGGVFGMVSDYHLELVERDGQVRVYLYDAYTKPLSVAGLQGTLEFEESTDKTTSLLLTPSADNGYLTARLPAGAGPADLTVKLPFRGERLLMTFPLQVTLKGRVVDVACFARDGIAALDRSHDECARACIAAGSPVGILTGNDAKSPVYLVTLRGDGFASKAANDKLLSFVNKQVHVSGKIIQRDELRFLELTEVQLAD